MQLTAGFNDVLPILDEDPTLPDLPCTANADCVNDTLGINSVKFCRCKKRFKPSPNEEKFPAFCVPDTEPEEVFGDYEYGGGLCRICTPRNYQFLLLFQFMIIYFIVVIML